MGNELISAAIGALAGLLAAYGKNLFDFRKEVNSELLAKRFEVYQSIWKYMQVLPKWPRSQDVTYQKLKEFSLQLQNWYFQEGGWLLSIRSRKAYGTLQDNIQEAINISKLTDQLSGVHYSTAMNSCSELRTELTEDLQSRKRSVT